MNLPKLRFSGHHWLSDHLSSTAEVSVLIAGLENQGNGSMSDTSEFEISSAILAAAVVAKSELTGQELASYAVNLQRQYIRIMQRARKEDAIGSA